MRLGIDNEPQPDALLLVEASAGGQCVIDTDGYITGGPKLVGEVAASSVGIDRHEKFDAYLANGVREYVLWRTEDNAIDWFILRNGQYVELTPAADGYLHSETFPGLWLDAASLLAHDVAEVLRVLQLGLATAEHAAFVARLQALAATA